MKNNSLLTVPDVARSLCIGRTKAYELVLSGEIASVRIGRCLRVTVADLELYVQSKKRPPVAQ